MEFLSGVGIMYARTKCKSSLTPWNGIMEIHRLQWLTCSLHGAGQKLPTRGRRRLRKQLAQSALVAFLLAFYVGVPLWFYLCPWVRRAFIFMHFADWPFQTFSRPENYGLNGTEHFFVETAPGVQLGAWHIAPRQGVSSLEQDDRPVVLYLHGSAESRTAAYRRSMYRVLSGDPLFAHVITFDYRGFGDSSYVSPTVQTVEEDATAMFQWLKRRVNLSRIIIWGHSMGTGIAIRIGGTLAKNNEPNPLAIVLEAAFTSIAEATKTFPLSFFHRHIPFFDALCTAPTSHPDTRLDSLERVGKVTAPLLMLHAADDSMVWSIQSKKLWQKAVSERPKHLHKPMFVELDGKYGCGHRNIHRAPNLPFEVESFLNSIKKHIQELT